MRMRVSLAVLGGTMMVAGPAVAGTKSQSSMAQPSTYAAGSAPVLTGPNGGGFVNGTSSGKTKGSDKCKVQVQLKGITVPDSDGNPATPDDAVICIADSKVDSLGGINTSAVFRGEVDGGQVKIKVDLFAEGTGCGDADLAGPTTVSYDSRLTCYAPDPAYDTTQPLTIPFASDANQGIVVGSYAARPASGLIATEGLFFVNVPTP